MLIRRIATAACIWFGLIGVVMGIVNVVAAFWPTLSAALERRVNPVVTDWSAQAERLSDGSTMLSVSGCKRRPECVHIPGSISLSAREPNGATYKVGVTFPDDPAPGSTRPGGCQSFGHWQVWTTPATPAGTAIHGVALALCQPGKPTVVPIDGAGWTTPDMPLLK